MTASPETLHLLAHQAQLRARTEPDWWDNPLDTALAAVSATRHAPAFREEGESRWTGCAAGTATGSLAASAPT